MKELRDQSVFAFFMMNALFVLIVFLLTLKKDYLHIKWPFGVRTNITYDETTQEVITMGSHGIFVGTFIKQVHFFEKIPDTDKEPCGPKRYNN